MSDSSKTDPNTDPFWYMPPPGRSPQVVGLAPSLAGRPEIQDLLYRRTDNERENYIRAVWRRDGKLETTDGRLIDPPTGPLDSSGDCLLIRATGGAANVQLLEANSPGPACTPDDYSQVEPLQSENVSPSPDDASDANACFPEGYDYDGKEPPVGNAERSDEQPAASEATSDSGLTLAPGYVGAAVQAVGYLDTNPKLIKLGQEISQAESIYELATADNIGDLAVGAVCAALPFPADVGLAVGMEVITAPFKDEKKLARVAEAVEWQKLHYSDVKYPGSGQIVQLK